MFSQISHIHVQNNNYSVMYEGVAEMVPCGAEARNHLED